MLKMSYCFMFIISCSLHLFFTLVFYACFSHLFFTLVLYTCSSRLFFTPVLHTCSLHLFFTLVFHTCFSHTFTTHVHHTRSPHTFTTHVHHTRSPHTFTTHVHHTRATPCKYYAKIQRYKFTTENSQGKNFTRLFFQGKIPKAKFCPGKLIHGKDPRQNSALQIFARAERVSPRGGSLVNH